MGVHASPSSQRQCSRRAWTADSLGWIVISDQLGICGLEIGLSLARGCHVKVIVSPECVYYSHLSAGVFSVRRQTNLAVSNSTIASKTQRSIKPVEPVRANTASTSHAHLPLKGGAEGVVHSRTAPPIARSASPTRSRTNHRVSSAPVRRRSGFTVKPSSGLVANRVGLKPASNAVPHTAAAPYLCVTASPRPSP